MPIYEYECLECGAHFDRLQRFGDPAPDTCPNGHPQVHRLLSQPAIIFKGSGFYVTDHRSNHGHSAPTETSEDSKSAATKSTDSKDTKAATSTSDE